MSGYDAVRWALAQDCGPGAKNVLVALAVSADQQGVTFYGQQKIATMLTTTDRAVRGHESKLAADGLITRYRRTRANGSRTSDLIVLNCPRERLDLADYSGIIVGREEGDVAPTGAPLPVGQPEGLRQGYRKTSSGPYRLEDRLVPPGEKNGRAKISGKPVDKQTWQRTLAALERFNGATGRNLSALTGRGNPSETAKRIYLRLVQWPDLDAERVREIVDLTLESRWWGEDDPDIGVIFGPKMWERNMARRPGEKPSARTRRVQQDAEKEARLERGHEAIKRLMGQA